MNPEDARIFANAVSNLAKQCLDHAAEAQVLKETLARLIARLDSKDANDVLKDLESLVNERQESYLLKIEDSNPTLAALMAQARTRRDPDAP